MRSGRGGRGPAGHDISTVNPPFLGTSASVQKHAKRAGDAYRTPAVGLPEGVPNNSGIRACCAAVYHNSADGGQETLHGGRRELRRPSGAEDGSLQPFDVVIHARTVPAADAQFN